MSIARNKIYRIPALLLATGLMFFISQCKPEEKTPPVVWPGDEAYSFPYRDGFFLIDENPDNRLTVNGVFLGRKLFYDTKLSGDNTQSCASCHKQEYSFSDAPNAFSLGIDGLAGDKNSMALINLAWNKDFFWDGRKSTLEAQALDPVRNPIEMHESWVNAVAKIQADTSYPPIFKKAFNTYTVDSLLIAKAITQFVKSIVVNQSKFQKNFRNMSTQVFNTDEIAGFELFMASDKGDCFHCHPPTGLLMTDNYINDPAFRMHNNGLDFAPPSGELTGRAKITRNASDNGKFKAPTLLNIALTPPYMHDGRFNTLEEVVEFYNSGVHNSPTLDVNMGVKDNTGTRYFDSTGIRHLNLTTFEKKQLVAFLKTLTDLSVTTNPEYSKP